MRCTRLLRSTLIVACLVTASASALARPIRVDMAGANNFNGSGELWTLDTNVELGGDSFATGAVPFALDFGAGAANYNFCFTENGYVSFSQTSTCNSLLPPTGDFMAVFANDLEISSAYFSVGTVDPTGPPYATAEAVDAMRFSWFGEDSSNAQLVAQLVLLNRGGGDFDIEMNYGGPFMDYTSSALGSQGITLNGVELLALTAGPFSGVNNYYYSMVDGKLSGVVPPDPDPPTKVDEPAGLALLAAALAALAIVRRRRPPWPVSC